MSANIPLRNYEISQFPRSLSMLIEHIQNDERLPDWFKSELSLLTDDNRMLNVGQFSSDDQAWLVAQRLTELLQSDDVIQFTACNGLFRFIDEFFDQLKMANDFTPEDSEKFSVIIKLLVGLSNMKMIDIKQYQNSIKALYEKMTAKGTRFSIAELLIPLNPNERNQLLQVLEG